MVKNIFLVGPMGAGKSTVGKKLSDLLCLQFCDSDQILASKHNSTIADIFSIHGEEYFRDQEQLLLREITRHKNVILAAGGGCILRANTRAILADNGLVCYLRVSPLQQVERNLAAVHRPTLPFKGPEQLKFFQKMHFERTSFYESIAHIGIDTDSIDADTTANMLFDSIKEYNASN
jgi:shikimate kinase